MNALLRAELLKLARQPATLFWGFLSVPIFAILFKLVLEGMVLVRTGVNLSPNTDLLLSAARTLSFSGNSVGHLLYAIGISSVFFMEYRFATWRHLVPRSSRLHLWAAKCLACLVCLFAGLLLAVAADVVLNVAISLIYGPGLSGMSVNLASFFTLITALAIALLELAVLITFVSAITILARSMVAAVIPAFLLPIGASLLQVYIGRTDDVLPLPSFGADALRGWLFSQGPAYDAWSGLGILAIWLIVASGIGIFAFSKQQLAVE